MNFDNDILDEIRSNYPLSEEEARSIAGSFLFSDDDIFKKIKNLSGGEKARVSFIKLILDKPNFLILDEPTNHLDIYSREILEDSLEDYEGTVLLISHDRYFLDRIVDKVYEITETGLIQHKSLANYKIEEKQDKNVDIEEKQEKIISYEEQKKMKNRVKSLEKKYSVLENEIEEKEAEKLKIEDLYNEAGRKNDYDKLIKYQNDMDNIDQEIMDQLEEMENIEIELEELKDMIGE